MNRTARQRALGISIGVGILGTLAVAPMAEAGSKTYTTTAIYSTPQNSAGDQRAVGAVTSESAGTERQGEHVTVKYFQKSGSSWDLLATHPKLNNNSQFKTAFSSVPNSGTCKLSAAYHGDSKNLPSKSHVVIDCATGAGGQG